MNEHLPGPRPAPRHRRTPGPIPAPVVPPVSADPDTIRRVVAALLEQADSVASSTDESTDESTDGEAQTQLAKQTDLLEQAHTVITDAMEDVDRV